MITPAEDGKWTPCEEKERMKVDNEVGFPSAWVRSVSTEVPVQDEMSPFSPLRLP